MEYEVLKCIVSVPIGSTAPISLWESIPSLSLIITLPLTKKHIRQSDTTSDRTVRHKSTFLPSDIVSGIQP